MEKVRHGTDMVQTPVFEGVCACIHTHSHKARGAITLPPCLRVKCRTVVKVGDRNRDGDVKKKLEK